MTPEQLLETPDLIAVGVAGDEIRRRMHGTKTTFNRVFEVHVDAPPQTLSPRLRQASGGSAEAVPATAERVHAGEFRVVGRPASLDALAAAVRATAAVAGNVPVTVFSLADVLSLRHTIPTIAAALKQAGLSAIVQLPLDLVENAEMVTLGVRAAGLRILTLGVDELEDSRRLEICQSASNLQAAVGGFKAFAPLPRRMSVTKPTTGYDDVKTVALARVVAANIESIQVDWALYGPKLAQVALTAGADDIDNVAAVDPGILGTRRSPLEEIKGNIKAASLEPVERDGLFVNRMSQLPTPTSHDS